MKTALNWVSEFDHGRNLPRIGLGDPLLAAIRAIQEDAIKHGVMLAAEIVDRKLMHLTRRPFGIDAQETHREILTLRDNFQMP